ncbi:MAG: hypothetical protein ACI4XN_12550 [Candidatus Kurthia intestinigallinarum]
MAVEKKLNVRVQLKHDSYENWVTNDPVLKQGEAAIAVVTVKQDGTANYVPSCLIKIGDGTHKYSELDFVYAKAADVIAACKSETALTTFVNNVISNAGIATDEAMTALAGRVTTAEGEIDGLQELVGETAVATQIANAIAGLNLSTTYETKGAAATAKSEVIGTDSDTATSDTIKGAKKYAESLDSAMDARVDALEAAVGEGGSVSSQITAEIQKLDKEDSAVDGQYVSAVSEADGVITVTRAALPDYTNVYAPKTHTHAIADVTGLQDTLDGKAAASDVTALSGKVTTLIGTDADKSVRTIANEELAAQLIPENAKESLDTLQEIASWIQSHPDDASAMNTRIGALETLVGDDSVSTQINAAIDALKIGDYAKAADLTAAVARIATLEGNAHTHANKALLDTYTQTEANLADAVSKKHSHANATVLDGITDTKVSAWDAAVQTVTAGTGLTATKTGTDVAIGFDDSVTFIFDCGDSNV